MVNNIKGNFLINVIFFFLINDKVKLGVWLCFLDVLVDE